MQTYVASLWIFNSCLSATSKIAFCNSGQNGSATEMCMTRPSSENEPLRDFVKSKNCVGNAKSRGANSSFKLPTPYGAIILFTPSSLNAQMFAL